MGNWLASPSRRERREWMSPKPEPKHTRFENIITEAQREYLKKVLSDECRLPGHYITTIKSEILICIHSEARAPSVFFTTKDDRLPYHIVSTFFKKIFYY